MNDTESRTLNTQGLATRKLVLEAAGRVFAQNGYDGAGFRDISKESGVGLSSIVYHFQSKQNLYIHTIRHFILDRARLNELFLPIAGLIDKPGSPQEIADALRDSCRNVLEATHGPSKAKYMNELYTGIMTGGNPEALKMLLECFVDVQQLLPRFLQHYWPEMTEQDMAFWIQLFWSQLQYTTMGRALILYDMQLGEDYPVAYLDQAAWHFAYYCCLPLGLPAPSPYPAV